MTRDLAPRQSPEERELAKKRAELAGLEEDLIQRELELATVRNELRAFERRYIRAVGVLFAQLDDLEAQIAEAEARRRPVDDRLKGQAARVRARATDSARLVGSVEEAMQPALFEPGEDLKKLYRDVAKRIHPDLAADDSQRARRSQMMALANEAYASGNYAALRAILEEWVNSPEAVEGEGIAVELVRTIRKIHQVEGRLSRLEAEMTELQLSDLWRLKQQVGEEHERGRDLLNEMAERLAAQIAHAKGRLRDLASQSHA